MDFSIFFSDRSLLEGVVEWGFDGLGVSTSLHLYPHPVAVSRELFDIVIQHVMYFNCDWAEHTCLSKLMYAS